MPGSNPGEAKRVVVYKVIFFVFKMDFAKVYKAIEARLSVVHEF